MLRLYLAGTEICSCSSGQIFARQGLKQFTFYWEFGKYAMKQTFCLVRQFSSVTHNNLFPSIIGGNSRWEHMQIFSTRFTLASLDGERAAHFEVVPLHSSKWDSRMGMHNKRPAREASCEKQFWVVREALSCVKYKIHIRATYPKFHANSCSPAGDFLLLGKLLYLWVAAKPNYLNANHFFVAVSFWNSGLHNTECSPT